MRNRIFYEVVLVLMLVAMPSFAQAGRALSAKDMDRLKAVKEVLRDVDTKTLNQTIADLERTGYPALNLKLREAMAQAFTDIVEEQKVVGRSKKQWLYSMITLNMAYLQMVGGPNIDAKTQPIDKLIRRKLVNYLPENIYQQPGFMFSPD